MFLCTLLCSPYMLLCPLAAFICTYIPCCVLLYALVSLVVFACMTLVVSYGVVKSQYEGNKNDITRVDGI